MWAENSPPEGGPKTVIHVHVDQFFSIISFWLSKLDIYIWFMQQI